MEKTISDFLNTENKEYAMYVLERRAIPSIVDGLKTSQRKILSDAFDIWKSNKKTLKVFQFAGSVAFNKNYNHGNVALEETIVGLCQDFKNNICLFDREGQFGSLRHPKGYGAARYIGCSLSPISSKIFLDNDLTTLLETDGHVVEPKFFLPIIPMLLVNGTSGIAVGFASNVLNRDPLTIVSNCISYLKNGKLKEMPPFINGFKGDIIQDSINPLKWYFKGSYVKVNSTTIRITEYCPQMTYDNIEKNLFKLNDLNVIVNYENNSKDSIDIIVKFKKEDLDKLSDAAIRKLLELDSSDVDDLTVLDENGKLKIFTNTVDILNHFMEFRLKIYTLRKNKLILNLKNNIELIANKKRFIQLYIDKKIKIAKVEKIKIIEQLTDLKFLKIDDTFDYLLNMPIYALTMERVLKLEEEYSEKILELEKIQKISEKDMYLEYLKTLENILKKK